MGIHKTGLLALAWMVLGGAACGAAEDPDGDVRQAQLPEMEEGQPIESGFVILRGRYVPPPYVVGRREDEVYVNGHRIATESLRTQLRGDGGPLGGPWRRGRRGPKDRVRRNRQYDSINNVAGIERALTHDALLVEFDGGTAVFVYYYQALDALDILLSDGTNKAKTQSLMQISVDWISSAQWAGLVETFEPTPECAERVRAAIAERDRRTERAMATVGKHPPAVTSPSKLTYVINVGGIALAVVALGSLLTYRPEGRARWHELDNSGDGVPLVVRNIVLLVLLGLFDLTCTLIAGRSGGLVELNPLGSQLLNSPTALAGFKIPLLVLSAAILLMLRRYRGAQIASWWLCLVCTVLTFRWATYNSMFLS